jgi:putative ABC transport system ATP-binding protein
MKPDTPLLQLDHVHKHYRLGEVTVPVLEDISLAVRSGEFIVVFGVSGSGKTTLLNLMGALDLPDSGRVLIDGDDTTAAGVRGLNRIRRDKLGFVFQFYNLFPTLTAAENVLTALEILPLSPEERRDRVARTLDQVGLADKAGKFPGQLSGGEQQRVAIARALAKQPRLILADEPTGNLDEHTADRIVDLMRRMNRETGATFVIVTHNPSIRDRADRVIEIHENRIVT